MCNLATSPTSFSLAMSAIVSSTFGSGTVGTGPGLEISIFETAFSRASFPPFFGIVDVPHINFIGYDRHGSTTNTFL